MFFRSPKPIESPIVLKEKNCFYCGKTINYSSTFCKYCGKPTERKCPACKEIIDYDAIFCDKCGVDIEEYSKEKEEDSHLPIIDRVCKIIANFFNEDEDSVYEYTDVYSDLKADELDIIDLLGAFEDAFDIEDMDWYDYPLWEMQDKVRTVNDFAEIIKEIKDYS